MRSPGTDPCPGIWGIALRSIFYHRIHYLLMGLVVSLSVCVVTGSLIVGDSVQESLTAAQHRRLGHVTHVIDAGTRPFRDDLGRRIESTKSPVPARAAAILRLRAILRIPESSRNSRLPAIPDDEGSGARRQASTEATPEGRPLGLNRVRPDTGRARVNQAWVIGVDPDFFEFSPRGSGPFLDPGVAWVNQGVADRLAIAVGDPIIIRTLAPSGLPSDSTYFSQEGRLRGMRYTVGGILEADRFGDFDPQADPLPPWNAFVGLRDLQTQLDMPSRANFLVATMDPIGPTPAS